MQKAYNIQWIYNKVIRLQTERWQAQGLLTPEQSQTIFNACPIGFRQSNAFVEIGAFLFTNIAVAGGYALLGLLLSPANATANAIYSCLFGIGLVFLNQVLIRQQSLYRSGIDNALVVSSVALIALGINVALPNETSLWARCLWCLPVMMLAIWHYGDTIVTFVAWLTLYWAIYDGLLTFSWGKAILPFMFMALSLCIYFLCHFAFIVPTRGPGRRAGVFSRTAGRSADKPATETIMQNLVYYDDAITITQWIALSMLLVSSNYFIVRELNAQLLRPVPAVSPDISLPWLFWAFTFLIPVGYAFVGLRYRNRVFLILAAIGIAGALSTFRHYHGFLPLSVHLTLCGVFTIGFAGFMIWLLRRPGHETQPHGFTDIPDEDSPREFFLNAELLATIQASASVHHPDPLRYGGGDFGGGGSSGKY
ncbi:hypothetical protein [Arsenicibacter rosenii]|uniref:DUF2157 domain-containing protein n=1 Tax=Arsenicibacter rosenii TaxID=1750698 RepID=A0A1S2VEU1_9BACT|nr:hypothetical protein [Arsenicibacter rosenii]OIN57243.1 hypothetical protein BLX24_21055 [Arsenicibacter rosenii]